MDLMAALRARGLLTPITIEPYLGESGAGPVYGPPVQVEAYVEAKRKLLRDAAERLVSNSMAVCHLDTTAPAKSRVTVAGVASTVLRSSQHGTLAGPLPAHLELLLT